MNDELTDLWKNMRNKKKTTIYKMYIKDKDKKRNLRYDKKWPKTLLTKESVFMKESMEPNYPSISSLQLRTITTLTSFGTILSV